MSTATKIRRTPAGKRVISPPIFPPAAGKCSGRDPLAEDCLAAGVALSLDLATSGIKQLARAGAVSPQRASAWRTEGRGNPIYDCSLIVYNLTRQGDHPGALIAQLQTSMMQGLLGLSDAELVRRFWLLCDEEHDAEAAENRGLYHFQRGGDLAALERADVEEAGLQLERAAVVRELRRRGIDPRKQD